MPGRTHSRIVVCAAAVLAATVLLSACDGARDGITPGATTEPAPDRIRQAPWKLRFQRVGGGGLTKSARKRYARLRRSAAGAVRTIYGGLFDDARTLRVALRRHFTRPTRRALTRSRAGVPPSGVLLRTRRRTAHVSIRGPGWSQAAARAVVVGRVKLRGRRLRLVHKAVMWLERERSRWRVVAFEFDQRRRR